MGNFATVADIEAFLQIDISEAAAVTAAEAALTEASAVIRNYCNQVIDEVVDDVITFDSPGGLRLFLPELPVQSVSLVVEDEETLTVDDDYKVGRWGILHRMPIGTHWASGVQNVTVTYTHGYYDIPDDILAVCVRAAGRTYQAGLKAADTEGVPGVSSKSLGDFSVSFQSEIGGGISEGLMGASGFRMLLMSEKDILNKYRVKGP